MRRASTLLFGALVAAVLVRSRKRRASSSSATASLLEGAHAQIIFFQTSWCPACQKAKPAIADIAKRHPNILFTDVDIEKDPETASAFRISSIPAFIALVDGKEVDRRDGFKDGTDLESFVSEALETESVTGESERKALEA